MLLNKYDLVKTFDSARENKLPFIFVGVEAFGVKEIISIPEESFDAKESYLNKTYDENLIMHTNENISIKYLGCGSNIEEAWGYWQQFG